MAIFYFLWHNKTEAESKAALAVIKIFKKYLNKNRPFRAGKFCILK
jgi:hypothetical protein